MTKYKEINGVDFEVIKSDLTEGAINSHVNNYRGATLNDYYQKPSNIKQAIYNKWLEWAACDEVHYFEVSSGSPFTFTLSAIYHATNGEQGYIHITKAHNSLYLCR